ncbi:MAG: siderophore-interacting protein [Marinomonas sp.]
MPRPLPRTLSVIDTQRISPSMHQITFGGPELAGFPAGQEGGYVKLMIKQADPEAKPLVRTYTIRSQRADALDVQFALHGHNDAGPATGWAMDAKIGDTLLVGGPGAAKPLPEGFDFYLIAGDMSALPAIAANLAALPADAKGFAAIEIQDEGDALPMDKPEGVEVQWLLNPEPGTQPQLLSDALRAAPRPEGSLAAWAACEFSSMKELRTYLREELALTPQELYISSYWKRGLDESEHKMAKREDSQGQPV